MSARKLFVIDTSVLLYDMKSIHSFPDNDVVIPLMVLDELDRFKDKPGLLGESARYVNRFLDDLRNQGNINHGILLPDSHQSIRVELRTTENKPQGFDPNRGDNQIILTALLLQEKNEDSEVKVITKDINLRVKCDAVGLMAEDYFKDDLDVDGLYNGWTKLDLSKNDIDEFYAENKLAVDTELFENQFIVAGSGQQSLLAIHREGNIFPLNQNISQVIKLIPRNKEQRFAVEALRDPRIPLVTLTGLAGSGKTFLSLMAALEGLQEERYKRIIITRSLQPVGREIGYLPGGLEEKMDPWLAPVFDNIRHAFKDTSYFNLMMQKGQNRSSAFKFHQGKNFSR